MIAAGSRRLTLLGGLVTLLVLLGLVTLSPGLRAAGSATLVINEIDYDQPGTDTAEFLELKNVSGGAIGLDDYSVELVNGTGGGASVYATIDLPDVSLAAGDYYVICANAATVANCDLDSSPDTNFIQNGAPDAIGLRSNGALVDAVSYEVTNAAALLISAQLPGIIDLVLIVDVIAFAAGALAGLRQRSGRAESRAVPAAAPITADARSVNIAPILNSRPAHSSGRVIARRYRKIRSS